jgi:hypothetical protein
LKTSNSLLIFGIINILQGVFFYLRDGIIVEEVFVISEEANYVGSIFLQYIGLVFFGIGVLLLLFKNESPQIGKKVLKGFCFIIGLPLLNVPILMMQNDNIEVSPIVFINFVYLLLALMLAYSKKKLSSTYLNISQNIFFSSEFTHVLLLATIHYNLSNT